jgi:hypothetical protein
VSIFKSKNKHSIFREINNNTYSSFYGIQLYNKQHKSFKSLNHFILCILLVVHLGDMGYEICTMMRKQLTSTPVVYASCTHGRPVEALILFHSMISTKGP